MSSWPATSGLFRPFAWSRPGVRATGDEVVRHVVEHDRDAITHPMCPGCALSKADDAAPERTARYLPLSRATTLCSGSVDIEGVSGPSLGAAAAMSTALRLPMLKSPT
jgi:hypothetical protein